MCLSPFPLHSENPGYTSVCAIHFAILDMSMPTRNSRRGQQVHLPKTLTSNKQLATLPAPSIAVYVTVVLPTGNFSPDSCVEELITTFPELSKAVGISHSATVSSEVNCVSFKSMETRTFSGHLVIVGFWLSACFLNGNCHW